MEKPYYTLKRKFSLAEYELAEIAAGEWPFPNQIF